MRNYTPIIRMIDSHIAALTMARDALVGNGTRRGAHKTRVISAAGRRRIAAAQRARWAKVRR